MINFVLFRFTKNDPYIYSTYGATCSTVEIDVLTGEMDVLRSDIMYDCGERSVHLCPICSSLIMIKVQTMDHMLNDIVVSGIPRLPECIAYSLSNSVIKLLIFNYGHDTSHANIYNDAISILLLSINIIYPLLAIFITCNFKSSL